jgi:hypothetical protein
VNFDEEVRWD